MKPLVRFICHLDASKRELSTGLTRTQPLRRDENVEFYFGKHGKAVLKMFMEEEPTAHIEIFDEAGLRSLPDLLRGLNKRAKHSNPTRELEIAVPLYDAQVRRFHQQLLAPLFGCAEVPEELTYLAEEAELVELCRDWAAIYPQIQLREAAGWDTPPNLFNYVGVTGPFAHALREQASKASNARASGASEGADWLDLDLLRSRKEARGFTLDEKLIRLSLEENLLVYRRNLVSYELATSLLSWRASLARTGHHQV